MKPLFLALAIAVGGFAASVDSAAAQDFELKDSDEPKTVQPTVETVKTYGKGDPGIDPKRRDERKAEKYLKKDKDWSKLDQKEKEVAIDIVARKIYAERKKPGRSKVRNASVKITVDDGDLVSLYKGRKALQVDKKYGDVVSEEETVKSFPPIYEIIPGEAGFEELQGTPLHNLFGDNKWEIRATGTDGLELVAQIEEIVASLNPGDRIVGVTIRSSASTLRSTAKEDGKPIDNGRLSELRGEAAKAFVVQQLGMRGVNLVAENIIMDAEGENGDGTSGPADPYGTGNKGNGQPAYKDIKDYAQHRYVDVAYMIYRENNTPDAVVEKKQPDVCDARVVSIDVTTKTKNRGGGGGRPPSNKKQEFETAWDMRQARKGRCPAENRWLAKSIFWVGWHVTHPF